MTEIPLTVAEGTTINADSNTYVIEAVEDGVIRVRRPSAGQKEYTPEELALSLNNAMRVEILTPEYKRGKR